MRQSRLTESRRAEYQYVIERFIALLCGGDKNFHLFAHWGLADVIIQTLWPNRPIDGPVLRAGGCGNDSIGLYHELSHHGLQCAANDTLTTQAFAVDRLNLPRCLGCFEAESNQGVDCFTDRIVALY